MLGADQVQDHLVGVTGRHPCHRRSEGGDRQRRLGLGPAQPEPVRANVLAVEVSPLAVEQRPQHGRRLAHAPGEVVPRPVVPAADDHRARGAEGDVDRTAAERGHRRHSERDRHGAPDRDRQRPDLQPDALASAARSRWPARTRRRRASRPPTPSPGRPGRRRARSRRPPRRGGPARTGSPGRRHCSWGV